jgi:hypothetical protein
MARRKARIPQGKKLQPAVKTMTFNLPSSPDYTNFYIDLSQCASILNRRFYRQGLNWAVAGFTWYTVADGALRVNKIPDTWVASNAWTKGFSIWRKQINESKAELGENFEGKFSDFKVYMNSDHQQNGVANNLIPRTGSDINTDYTVGEWDMSQIVIAASDSSGVTEYDLIWTGDNTGPAKSLIQGYADSRALPYEADPNVPDAASLNWMSATFNEGTLVDNAVINNLEQQNDQAPYPYEDDGTATVTQYPGGASQAPGLQESQLAFTTATTVGGRTQIPGDNFQGGLINLELQHTGSSVIQVHLVSGPHRGYMCQKMQDV